MYLLIENWLAAERLKKTAPGSLFSLNESSRPSTPLFNNIYSGSPRAWIKVRGSLA